MSDVTDGDLLELTADIVTAHLSNNRVAAAELPALITSVHEALARLGARAPEIRPPAIPAVTVRASIKENHLVCLEDGMKFTSLKRHLKTKHGMTPDEYRAKWNLPSTYPMVAPSYSEVRQALAIKSKLGQRTR
jgi:predicted transcriptional regulator